MAARITCASAGLLLGLAACHPTQGELASLAEPAFQSQAVALTHEVHFAGGATSLDVVQRGALDRFLGLTGPRGDETLLVSAGGPAAPARIQAVASALGQRGARSAALVTGPADGPVLVTLYRTVTLASGCLQADDYGATATLDLPPLGCANDANLAKMVETPSQLFLGAAPGPAEAGPAAAAVRRYRTDTTTPLIIEAPAP